MKITIESEDLDRVNDRIKKKDEEINELKERLKLANPEDLERRVRVLSWRLFEKYIAVVFKKLGFQTNGYTKSFISSRDCFYSLGEDWFEKDDEIIVSLSAKIYPDFREAFLNIGVIVKPHVESKFIENLEKE